MLYETVLKPASGGFGEWDWVETSLVLGIESLEDYEGIILAELDWTKTDELSGRIHDERGEVYKVLHEPYPDGQENASYHMVWEDLSA